MKILIVLYGLGRGIEVSSKSINDKIIIPLKTLGYQLKIVYVLKSIENKDFKKKYFGEDIFFSFKEPEYFDFELYNLIKKGKDIHDDNFKSLGNLLYQLMKIKLSSQIVNYSDYSRVVFCRDDLYFKDYLNWEKIIELSSKRVILSQWFWNNGLSERFLVSNNVHSNLISNRIEDVPSLLKHNINWNGEMLMKFIFDKNRIPFKSMNIKFFRVRNKDLIVKEKFYYPIHRPKELLKILLTKFF